MAAAAGAGADAQELQPVLTDAHPQESQDSVSQQPRFLKILPSSPPFLPQQPVSHPHGAATSQPQLGAAQPVLQAGAQAVSQPQLGAAQAGAHADPHGSQPVSQQRLPPRLCNARTSSSNGLRRGLQQVVSQPQLGAHALSTPQVGPHPLPQAGAHAFSIPQLGAHGLAQPVLHAGAQADSHPQLGAAPQPVLQAGAQAFPQADSHPQLGAAHAGVVSQQVLSQPQPLRPSKRSSNPPAKV